MPDPKKTDSEKITEYRNAIVTLTAAARVLGDIDIPVLLRAIEYADSFGPLLDPTLWRDKHGVMEEDRKLLMAALPLHQFGKMLEEKFPFSATRGACNHCGKDGFGDPCEHCGRGVADVVTRPRGVPEE